MDNDKPEECKVCFNVFDEELRRPRTLHCGHTYCSPCIEGMIKSSKLSCPGCRTEHKVDSISQFPISFGMEAFIRKLSCSQPTSSASTEETVKEVSFNEGRPKVETLVTKHRARGISKKLQAMVQEHMTNMRQIIRDNQEVQASLHKYQDQLRDWKTHHQHLQDKLFGLLERNKAAMELLEEEGIKLSQQIAEGDEDELQIQAMLQKLGNVATPQEVFLLVNEADGYNVDAEDWNQKCCEQFPDISTVHTSIQVREVIQKVLETVPTGDDFRPAPELQSDTSATILDKLEEITKHNRKDNDGLSQEITKHNRKDNDGLTVEGLLSLSEAVKKQVKAGKVVAVQEVVCSFSVTLDNNNLLCLHSIHPLLDQPPPSEASILQLSNVMGVVDRSSTLVFLELAWPGVMRRRVYIRLSPDTRQARLFMLLCTGQCGHSYKNTRFYSVLNKGEQGESVCGGNFQCNLGRGDATLLPDDHQDDCGNTHPSEGAVYTFMNPFPVSTGQFRITTRSKHSGGGSFLRSLVIGQVVSGLEVVKEAANHINIMNVVIVDCGVVINN